MARLDIAEKRLPQDGRVSLRVGGHEVDVRVSTIPSQHGERVVMRLLDRDSPRLCLEALGLGTRDLDGFTQMLRRPNGILLVTGPTGSGKTTTLYAALGALNDRQRNIMTVEDPIEYAVEGVGQTQVNARTDLTFARGLRAILRQDPDIIMVGEIRDRDTAQVAVQASMTGHFVLSTLHTNSAVGSVTRLIDMGVERFLLAPMLTGLIAQRLVRTLCAQCREPSTVTALERDLLGGAIETGAPLCKPVGCSACHGSGYRGRTAIYEVVAINAEMESLIHDGASEAALLQAARRAGPSLLDDGAAKVCQGLTSVEEVARVVQDM
jgi:general secretion pathway protein E